MKINSKLLTLTLFLSSSMAVAAGPQAQDLYNNDDGRVTIVKPLLNSPDGNIRGISANSDPHGLCKLFGFGRAVFAGMMVQRTNERLVVINRQAKFAGFQEPSTEQIRKIVNLMCESQSSPVPSTRYSALLRNIDGTYSIIDPAFGHPDGQVRYLNEEGAKGYDNGICKLFGFYRTLPYGRGKTSIESEEKTVLIDGGGKFAGFRVSSSSYENKRLKSIVCE